MRTGWRTTGFVALAAILAAAGGGCGDTGDPAACLGAGRLGGRVTTGRLPVEADVVARMIVDAESSGPDFRVEVDEDGRYGMDLPGGDYVLEVRAKSAHYQSYYWTAAGPAHRFEDPDTVRIDAGVSPVAADFRLGALAVDAAMSRSLEGEDAAIRLHLRGESEEQFPVSPHAVGRTPIHDGRAELLLVGLRPGRYRVELEVAGDRFWLPGTLDPGTSPWFRVAPDSVTDVALEAALEPARLEGRVTGAGPAMGWGTPWIEVFTADSTRITNEVTRLPDGRFDLLMHLPRPVKFAVHQGGFVQWIGGPGFHEATVYTPVAGEVLAGIELVQSGMILDMAWAKETSFWPRVRLYEAKDLRLVASVSAAPGPDRREGIPNLWPGDFLLHFTPGYNYHGVTPWLAQWYDRANDPASARVVTIADRGEIVRVDVRFEEGGVMEGRLQVAEPGRVDRWIVVTPLDDPAPWGRAFARDGATAFAVRGLPDGDYRLGVLPDDHDWNFGRPLPPGTVWWPGTAEWAGAGAIAITGAGTVTDLVVPLD